MIKLYICCLVLIIGSVEVGPDIDMKFHQEVMEIVSYDSSNEGEESIEEDEPNNDEDQAGEVYVCLNFSYSEMLS